MQSPDGVWGFLMTTAVCEMTRALIEGRARVENLLETGESQK